MFRLNSIKCLAVVACVAAAPAAVRAQEAVDAASPKGVAIKFVEAVSKGDNAGIRANGTGTEDQFKAVESLAMVLPAIEGFKKACDAKFGPDNVLSKNMAGGMTDLTAEAKKADYKVEGDTATAVDKDKPNEKNPMKLKKVDGVWKVDLASMGDDAAEIAKKAPAMAKVFNDAAKEITDGKYANAEAAALAIGPKMMEAMK